MGILFSLEGKWMWGPFLFAAGACFPAGRASSATPSIPIESSDHRFNSPFVF